MKQTVLDVLMYMFGRCLQSDDRSDTDPDSMHIRLRREGFSEAKIEQAFDWLQPLDTYPGALATTESQDAALRVYHASEIDTRCRTYLVISGSNECTRSAKPRIVHRPCAGIG